jgi:hypothetical protein
VLALVYVLYEATSVGWVRIDLGDPAAAVAVEQP